MSSSRSDIASQYCLKPEWVIKVNARAVRKTGEPHVVLDRGKLESALFRPVATMDGKFLHRTLLERGAALLDALCQCHAFQQGNKRTAWTSTTTYLGHHQIFFSYVPDAEAAAFVNGVVEHEYGMIEIVFWLADRIR